MYSSTLSLNSAIDRSGGSLAAVTTAGGGNRYPLYKRLGGPQDRSGRVRKISPPQGSIHRPFSRVTMPTTLTRPVWIHATISGIQKNVLCAYGLFYVRMARQFLLLSTVRVDVTAVHARLRKHG
jgi:hypothetical protein